MKIKNTFLLYLALATTTLSSCSRANYSFNTSAPAYLGSAQVSQNLTSPTEVSLTQEGIATNTVIAELTPVTMPVRQVLRTASSVAARTLSKPATLTKALGAPLKADRKTVRKAIRQLATPQKAAADGKSQTTALILCILLGGIGVHQFYLGYTGRGILRIALALTSFLIVPAIINLVLYILDIIKIINGELKPKGGDYAKKFNN